MKNTLTSIFNDNMTSNWHIELYYVINKTPMQLFPFDAIYSL